MTDLRAVRDRELPVLGAHLLAQLLGHARLLPDQTPTEFGAFVLEKSASDARWSTSRPNGWGCPPTAG